MRSNPERLAWSVLVLSFVLCCSLAVGVPTAATSFVNSATLPAQINVKLQSGRTIAFGPRETETNARVVGIDGRNIEEGSTIIVDADLPSQAVVVIGVEATGEPLATVQMYSGAKLRVARAEVPRFSLSTGADRVELQLLAGRVSVSAPQPAQRNTRVEIRTDLATIAIRRGLFTVEHLPAETRVAVREGAASVTSLPAAGSTQVSTLELESGQRSGVRAGSGLLGVLPPGLDLVANGRFGDPIEPNWKSYAESITQPKGDARSINIGGETALLIDRAGQGLNWGRTGVTQDLNVDASGRSVLQLRLVFSIVYQELAVCGGQGSECPLMVTVGYRDASNADREWTQGFYADGTPSNDLPDEVRSAPLPRTKHVKKGLGTRESFEVDLFGLLPDLKTVRYLRLNAEGHGLRSIVYSAELVLQD